MKSQYLIEANSSVLLRVECCHVHYVAFSTSLMTVMSPYMHIVIRRCITYLHYYFPTGHVSRGKGNRTDKPERKAGQYKDGWRGEGVREGMSARARKDDVYGTDYNMHIRLQLTSLS